MCRSAAASPHRCRVRTAQSRQRLDERWEECQPVAVRDELAERHQMNLPIHGERVAVRADQERRVVGRRSAERARRCQTGRGCRAHGPAPATACASPLGCSLNCERGQRRLRPENELRPAPRNVARDREVRREDAGAPAAPPFRLLRDVRPGPGRRLGGSAAAEQRPSADAPRPTRGRHTRGVSTAAVTRPARRRPDDSSAQATSALTMRHQCRQSVHAEHARQLRHRQHRHLAVAERHPWESLP